MTTADFLDMANVPVGQVLAQDEIKTFTHQSLYIRIKCKVRLMNTHEAKLSSKNQIVVPRQVRDALGIKSGDKLLLVVRGGTVIMLQKPKKHSSAVSGMAKGLYPAEYLEMERESWRRKKTG